MKIRYTIWLTNNNCKHCVYMKHVKTALKLSLSKHYVL